MGQLDGSLAGADPLLPRRLHRQRRVFAIRWLIIHAPAQATGRAFKLSCAAGSGAWAAHTWDRSFSSVHRALAWLISVLAN